MNDSRINFIQLLDFIFFGEKKQKQREKKIVDDAINYLLFLSFSSLLISKMHFQPEKIRILEF
jgi:hypothetical protein